MTILILALSALVVMHLMDRFVLRKGVWLIQHAWLLWIVLVILQTLCLMTGEPSNEFIYFQF